MSWWFPLPVWALKRGKVWSEEPSCEYVWMLVCVRVCALSCLATQC